MGAIGGSSSKIYTTTAALAIHGKLDTVKSEDLRILHKALTVLQQGKQLDDALLEAAERIVDKIDVPSLKNPSQVSAFVKAGLTFGRATGLRPTDAEILKPLGVLYRNTLISQLKGVQITSVFHENSSFFDLEKQQQMGVMKDRLAQIRESSAYLDPSKQKAREDYEGALGGPPPRNKEEVEALRTIEQAFYSAFKSNLQLAKHSTAADPLRSSLKLAESRREEAEVALAKLGNDPREIKTVMAGLGFKKDSKPDKEALNKLEGSIRELQGLLHSEMPEEARQKVLDKISEHFEAIQSLLTPHLGEVLSTMRYARTLRNQARFLTSEIKDPSSLTLRQIESLRAGSRLWAKCATGIFFESRARKFS